MNMLHDDTIKLLSHVCADDMNSLNYTLLYVDGMNSLNNTIICWWFEFSLLCNYIAHDMHFLMNTQLYVNDVLFFKR